MADDELENIPFTSRGMGLRVSRKTKLMGVNGLGMSAPRPVEEGSGQRTVVEVPEQCEKCGAFAVSLLRGADYGMPRRVSCFMCGWNAFLVTPPQAQIVTAVERERGFAAGSRAVVQLPPTTRPVLPRRRDGRRRLPQPRFRHGLHRSLA